MKIIDEPADQILRIIKIVPDENEKIKLVNALQEPDGTILIYFSTSKFEKKLILLDEKLEVEKTDSVEKVKQSDQQPEKEIETEKKIKTDIRKLCKICPEPIKETSRNNARFCCDSHRKIYSDAYSKIYAKFTTASLKPEGQEFEQQIMDDCKRRIDILNGGVESLVEKHEETVNEVKTENKKCLICDNEAEKKKEGVKGKPPMFCCIQHKKIYKLVYATIFSRMEKDKKKLKQWSDEKFKDEVMTECKRRLEKYSPGEKL